MTAPFPPIPAGWYHACHRRDLAGGPVGLSLRDARFVAFLDAHGKPSVLDARCAHMGADLSRGKVCAGVLHCPLHDWRYDGAGRCVRIPASDTIPPFAVQTRYPVAEIGGHVAFCNAPTAPYPMPFFAGRSPDELCPAAPFDIELECPWYLVGANGFDVQHFRVAHDRTLIDEPVIDSPAPFAQRIAATYDVSGAGFRDALTRRFAGGQVRMTVTSWAGVNIVVSAEFQRTTTYGMVFVRPLGPERTLLRTIVWVARGHGALDPVAAAIRRRFIQAFLHDDAARAGGTRYNPATLIDADHVMRRYLQWLAGLSNGSAATNETAAREGSA